MARPVFLQDDGARRRRSFWDTGTVSSQIGSGRILTMSAQRRTTVKEKSPAPSAAKTTAAKTTAPSNRPKEKTAADRGKAVAETRQSIISARTQSVRQLFRDSWSEMKKVNWPDQQTTRNLTVVVIGISVVLGLLLGGIDFLLQKLFELMS
jgi:preprotein translocase subunit SecE